MRRWEELRQDLDARGIAIVAVCADTLAEIRAGRHKHGLQARFLADPDLAATDRYGLRNQLNVTPTSRPVRPLPIPTTLLVDAQGIVRWIDQSTDYQLRSEPGRVLAAIDANLPR